MAPILDNTGSLKANPQFSLSLISTMLRKLES
jgi:hypothetical protein